MSDKKDITAEDIAELQKALEVGNNSGLAGQVLQVGNFPSIPTWAVPAQQWKDLFGPYERIFIEHPLFTKTVFMRKQRFNIVAEMLKALSNTHIIRDSHVNDGTIYTDPRPWVEANER